MNRSISTARVGRPDDRFSSETSFLPRRDVLLEGAAEQEHVLEDRRDRAPAGRSCERSRMSTPSIRIRPRADVVEAGQQLDDRRLPGARRADERDPVWPGSTRKDTSRRTHAAAPGSSPAVRSRRSELSWASRLSWVSGAYENQTCSNSTEPRRPALGQRRELPAREIGATAGSASTMPGLRRRAARKMRSLLAIEDCMTEYFADRSRSGMKKRRIQVDEDIQDAGLDEHPPCRTRR